jgi:hypothetical protein
LFVDDLGVAEEEADWFVLKACQEQDFLDIFPPRPHVVAFGDLDLE